MSSNDKLSNVLNPLPASRPPRHLRPDLTPDEVDTLPGSLKTHRNDITSYHGQLPG